MPALPCPTQEQRLRQQPPIYRFSSSSSKALLSGLGAQDSPTRANWALGTGLRRSHKNKGGGSWQLPINLL